MALKDTCKNLKGLLDSLQADLEKAEAGNKAAAQRVRTGSIKFERTAKIYRRESILADKNGAMNKTKAALKKKSATSNQKTQNTSSKKSLPASKSQPTSGSKSQSTSGSRSQSSVQPTPSKTPVVKQRAPTKKVTAVKKKPTAKLPKAGRKKK